MATAIVLPGLGESIAEGTIVAWRKQPGDFVARDETFVTVSTDKVETDLPSLDEGYLLAHAVAEGDVARIGDVIGWLGAEGEEQRWDAGGPDRAEARHARHGSTRVGRAQSSAPKLLGRAGVARNERRATRGPPACVDPRRPRSAPARARNGSRC